MALSVFGSQAAFAGKNQSIDEIRAITCNALKGTGNLGVEFYFTFDPCYEESGNNRLMLYLASASAGYATVEVVDKGYKERFVLKANDVVPVSLGPGNGQAFSKPINGGIPPEQVYPGAAIHITSTVPIVVYGVTRFAYTSDSFMALPVQSLGKEYIVASMADMTWMFGGLSLPSETAIVAAYDNTNVEFTLGGPSVTKTGGGMRPGDTKRFTMNKGDVWVVGNDAQSKEGDMSGSIIKATKPVGVISGNQCANVPTDKQWCDFISEMELPTNLWGRNLQIPKYASRTYGYYMKVFAKSPNTKISYNGSYWRTIQTAGGSPGRGWIYERVDGSGNNVVSLSADKPISATVFNTGQSDDNVSTDPFQMNVMPIEQYQKNVIFCTPGTKGGINFTRNYLGVVFQLDSTGAMPKDLEFGVSVNGKIKWQTLASKFGPAFSTKDIFKQKVNGKEYAFKECTLGADGVYALRCSLPFMSYNYGGSDYDSYGHPTSGALSVVADIPDTLQPVPHYKVECDGSVGILEPASVVDLPNDSNCSNMSTIILVADSSYNYTLDFDYFEAGAPAAKTVKWRLTVDNPDQDGHALVVFTDRAGNQSCIEVDYRAVNLTIVPNFYNYSASGPVKKGEVRTQDFKIVNKGNSEALVARLEFKNGGAGVFDFVPKVQLPFMLKAGETRDFTVQYTASNDGYVRDSIGVGDTCVFNYRTHIEAKTGEPVINVDDIDFGTVVINTTTTKTFNVYSQGKVKLTIKDQSGIVPATTPYTSNVPTNFPAVNLTLDTANAPNLADRKEYSVDFKPTVEGKFDATITFTSDASTIKNICNITGVAVKPGLLPNGVDFGRCRISGNKKYSGPYTYNYAASGTAYLELKNTGTAKVTISDAVVTKGDLTKFQLEQPLNYFKGLDIAPGASIKLTLMYIPDSPMNDELNILFTSDADPVTFKAIGTGVVPRIKIDDVDFGMVQLVNGSGYQSRTFTIKNLSQAEWPFCDTLSLTNLLDATGGISDDYANGVVGSEKFAWNRTELNFPVRLDPGQTSPVLNAHYRPNAVATNKSTLTTESDAETEQTSKWNGSASGGALLYTIDPDDAQVCVNGSITFNVTIKNIGDSLVGNQPFLTGSFRLQSGPNADIVLPANITTPILCGETRVVTMTFTPKTAGANTYKLICEATPGAPFVVATGDFTVTGLTYPSKLYSKNVINGSITTDGSRKYFDFPISLDKDLDAANVHSLSVVVKFYKDHMDINKTGNDAVVTLNSQGGAAAGWIVNSANVQTEGDSIAVTVKLSGNTPLKGGAGSELFKLQFQMLLNVTTLPDFDSKGTTVEIYPAMAYSDQNFTNQTCAVIEGSTQKITAEAVCAYSFNHLTPSVKGQFELRTISPNPVGASGTKIDFGVGYDTQTRIDIIGSNGEIVATLVNERLNGGSYTLNFVPNNLASGSYIVRMISGSNSYTQRLQVVK